MSLPVSQRRIALALAFSAVAALAACAQTSSNADRTASVATMNTVEGKVSWRERMALPPDAVLVVEVQDTSRADAPAQTIAQQAIRLQNLNPPYSYKVSVDPAKLNPAAQYTITARVSSDGDKKLIFINDVANPVLTRGAGNKVDMMLVRTGS
ncbi:YbaY family lipoprotein [Comamonas fluminis]|uniref:YbaY family lipoprotein n=1 Tax=Comamonas fluminis TaxID=2796366 RepID=UPI001C495C14|nr:YbaY family lipoprotein [Comamonas fluminis]